MSKTKGLGTWGMTQVTKCLPNMNQALYSIPSTTKEAEEEEEEKEKGEIEEEKEEREENLQRTLISSSKQHSGEQRKLLLSGDLSKRKKESLGLLHSHTAWHFTKNII
jgi:hypothetical protein